MYTLYHQEKNVNIIGLYFCNAKQSAFFVVAITAAATSVDPNLIIATSIRNPWTIPLRPV